MSRPAEAILGTNGMLEASRSKLMCSNGQSLRVRSAGFDAMHLHAYIIVIFQLLLNCAALNHDDRPNLETIALANQESTLVLFGAYIGDPTSSGRHLIQFKYICSINRHVGSRTCKQSLTQYVRSM